MGIRDRASLQRLGDMGIEVWRLRQPGSFKRPPSVEAGDADCRPRIRLSSGDGDWLLVRRAPWRGSHEALVADIMATIGPERCRFGQWSKDTSSGEGIDELAERGIKHILCFGRPENPPDWPQLMVAPALDELAGDPEARRELWRMMSPRIRR